MVAVTEKACRACHEVKPTSAFGGYKSNPDGLNARCKPCVNDGWNKRYAGLSADERRRQSALRQARFRLSSYGLTVPQYEAMFAAQNGVCAICGQPETRLTQAGEASLLAVDHDHSCCSGKTGCGKCVRGLLCFRCNVAIGYLQEDRRIVAAALDYLTRDQGTQAA